MPPVNSPEASLGFTNQLTSKYNYIFSTLNTYFHQPASLSIPTSTRFQKPLLPTFESPFKTPQSPCQIQPKPHTEPDQNHIQNLLKTTYRTWSKSSRKHRLEQPSIARTEESSPAQTGTPCLPWQLEGRVNTGLKTNHLIFSHIANFLRFTLTPESQGKHT